MEKYAEKLANNISMQLGYDSEKEAVIRYGLVGLFQVLAIFAIITLFGYLFGCLNESWIVFLCVGLLRKSTGGAHAQTITGCLIMSCLIIMFISLISHYGFTFVNQWITLGICTFIYGLSMVVSFKKVPVDTPNKRITNEEKIKRLRRKSFVTLTFFFMICILFILFTSTTSTKFYLLPEAISLSLGMLWQIFTLTRLGGILIDIFDSKFRVDEI